MNETKRFDIRGNEHREIYPCPKCKGRHGIRKPKRTDFKCFVCGREAVVKEG